MQVYEVGGCVRDELLGRTPKDIDYVVVGASAEELIQAGFKQVGADFPVFLHPETGDEYALARTERKSGVGYHGFQVNASAEVTLEEDLARRDLTINSMAKNRTTGEIVDPFGGKQDLANKLIRHTSEAFAEDPVRILRAARFSARYGFSVHPTTMTLMRTIVEELNHVAQERIWAEIEKGLGEGTPARMMEVLEQCHALETDALRPYSGWNILLHKVTNATPLSVRVTLVTSGFLAEDYVNCRVPSDFAHIAQSYRRHGALISRYSAATAEERLGLLMSFRALASTQVLDQVIEVVAMAFKGLSAEDIKASVHADIKTCGTVDAKAIAQSCANSEAIKLAIFDARVKAISQKRSQDEQSRY